MLLQMAEHGAVTSQTVIYGYLDMGESTSLIWKPPPHYGTLLWLWTKYSEVLVKDQWHITIAGLPDFS
ncbi:hypothetical protein COH20_008734 [Aspergillus flavus]|uniref:Uncharacterized protein n=1 Tax=Aspergillus flavus TaxID=5059 RepID=A0AB74BND9_ASPFL|nr:hypothetical protein COH21_003094 [Aspergillus flavus]RAQ77581.1 hypothetical protein COH20_008734 [Aspergillus flavus]RMZ35900.1 hypothetical protein CA14_009761 [Aspergillus flavus]